jgi:hypothetical protein
MNVCICYSINLKKIYIRFTYFMFYLVKVSPIARVTSSWISNIYINPTIHARSYFRDLQKLLFNFQIHIETLKNYFFLVVSTSMSINTQKNEEKRMSWIIFIIYIRKSLDLSEKKILNETKNHTPLQVKWSVP